MNVYNIMHLVCKHICERGGVLCVPLMYVGGVMCVRSEVCESGVVPEGAIFCCRR